MQTPHRKAPRLVQVSNTEPSYVTIIFADDIFYNLAWPCTNLILANNANNETGSQKFPSSFKKHLIITNVKNGVCVMDRKVK